MGLAMIIVSYNKIHRYRIIKRINWMIMEVYIVYDKFKIVYCWDKMRNKK